MTDRKQPHPQRCETCKKYSERAHPIYEGNIIAFCGEERTQVETKAITCNHGCASHSSASEPVPAEDCDRCRFVKDCTLLYAPPCYNGAAVKAAKQARAGVLDDVIKFCETEHSAPLHEETAFRVSRYAKSLRQQEGMR